LTLYYIRHAEVVANTLDPAEVTYENSETLTALGEKQIESLTSYLLALDVTPDAIVSSPMRRTQKTIEPYLVAKQLKGELWMTLAECCNTTPTGAELPTAPQYTPLKATVESGNFSFTVPTENRFWKTDTYEEGLYMVSTARSELLKRYSQSGKTVFVIGHASAGLVMIGLLGGSDMRQGTSSSGPNAVFLLNTGVMRLIQDPTTGMFKLDGRNINNPVTK
jgi:broad specificity phosphatase PhoE